MSMKTLSLSEQKEVLLKKKLAENAGISQMACSRVLSGDSKINAELLRGFAFTLGIRDMNIFFDDNLTDSVISEYSTPIMIDQGGEKENV